MIKAIFEGKFIGHPIHPILVHLPIGLFTISFAFDVGGICNQITSPDYFIRPAFYTMLLGELVAIIAAAPGLVDYLDIRRDHPAKSTATTHMWLNVIAVFLYLLNLAIRWNHFDHSEPLVMPVALSVCALVMVGISGYLGGVMVYDDGIAVGRHRRWGKTPTQTLLLDNRAVDSDGFVEVIDERQLKNRQSLRVDLRGTTMAIARSGGQVFAFQEFCTHRFGPLSEGSFRDTQVTCPWHGSCFDMLTGKVCAGPAKEPLRVFEVRIRDGKVWVQAPETTQQK
jgi:nitrite reductase/ring-hydroxylating ferredoxin subunit/uncharacterized membrane protein